MNDIFNSNMALNIVNTYLKDKSDSLSLEDFVKLYNDTYDKVLAILNHRD